MPVSYTHLEGIDIADDYGSQIVATAAGVVTFAGYTSGGYGNLVEIDHGNGCVTRYGHNSAVLVTVGMSVKQGQTIALMGSTGKSTGAHVHYEVRLNNTPCLLYTSKTKRNQRQTVSIAANDLGVETNINKLYAILLHKEKEDANLRSASSFFS